MRIDAATDTYISGSPVRGVGINRGCYATQQCVAEFRAAPHWLSCQGEQGSFAAEGLN